MPLLPSAAVLVVVGVVHERSLDGDAAPSPYAKDVVHEPLVGERGEHWRNEVDPAVDDDHGFDF